MFIAITCIYLNAYIKSFRIKIISSNIIFLSFYLYSHCVVLLSGINAISFKVILYLTTSFFSTDHISIFDDNSSRSMLTLYYKIHSALSTWLVHQLIIYIPSLFSLSYCVVPYFSFRNSRLFNIIFVVL